MFSIKKIMYGKAYSLYESTNSTCIHMLFSFVGDEKDRSNFNFLVSCPGEANVGGRTGEHV